MALVRETSLGLPLLRRGKVRDTYDLGSVLLMVATDRISAFDVVLPSLIPDKGEVLNRLSAFWFEKTASLVPNHMIAIVDALAILASYLPQAFELPDHILGRAMVVKKAQVLPVECVVRGYLYGSAWEEYREKGEVSGYPLPQGLREADRLPQPLFTPTTKALTGHDQPLSPQALAQELGARLAQEVEEKAKAIYHFARDYALGRGIIIADTKLEFGLTPEGLLVVDELLTPDSSRFWDAQAYEPGKSQPSWDKQPVRDFLSASDWRGEPPAPALPLRIVQETSSRYKEVYRKLTGRKLED